MKRFLLALQFLTILPVKIKGEIRPDDFGKSFLYFPVVGFLIGLTLSLFSFILNFLPDLVRAALILLALIFMTGAVHLDGFTDFCDGFYGGKSKEKILEIMRDSRIGVMGAIGIVCILLLKFALIASTAPQFIWKSLILMTSFARWSQGLACYISKYARDEGKAKFFVEYVTKKEVALGGLFIFLLFCLLKGFNGLVLFLSSLVLLLLFINYVKRKIDGMTGDTIGAVSEIAEILVLFLAITI